MLQDSGFIYDVFLSFSVRDTAVARKIWQQLTNNHLNVFWSDSTLKKEAGESWFNKVEDSLEKSQHMVVLITKNSLRSEWVLREYKAFLNSCYRENVRRLIPVLDYGIEISHLPLFMREFQSYSLEDMSAVEQMGSLLAQNSMRLAYEASEKVKAQEELVVDPKPTDTSNGSHLSGLGEFVDPRDQNKYRTVKIGDQVWFADNLRFESSESRLYKNLDIHAKSYGRLYHWEDALNACPDGWCLPDYSDWDELIISMGGYGVAGEKLVHSNFFALYGGMALRETFAYIKRHGYFWSRDAYDRDNAWRYDLYKSEKEINKDIREKELFYSVRCIQRV